MWNKRGGGEEGGREMCEREEGDKRKERCGRKKGRQIGANMQERGEGETRAKETKRRGREVNNEQHIFCII